MIYIEVAPAKVRAKIISMRSISAIKVKLGKLSQVKIIENRSKTLFFGYKTEGDRPTQNKNVSMKRNKCQDDQWPD